MTHTKASTEKFLPRLPISQYTAVLRSSLNTTGSHRRPSPCANSEGINAHTVISVGQYSFVACLGNIQVHNSPDVTLLESRGNLTTNFSTVLNLIIAMLLRIRIPTTFLHLLVRNPSPLSAYVISSHDHLLSTHLDSKLVVMLEVRDTLDAAQCSRYRIVSHL